ncbi:transcriptional adapter 3-A-like isoform X2 [Clavelina lepadiformis]|uniref:transcriptional adapter 3-A-like isoform X2 n=1 Tax=Clavelina lepadiformis TaxID=159417 RepID=UPI0040423CA0
MGDRKDVLKFPALNLVDHPRHCQQYTNVLSRQVDDSVSVEEIDVLQMDLETLLAAATSRMRQLQTEIQILSDMGESTKKEKKKDSDKRTKPMDDRPTKKLKASDSPAHTKYVSANQGSGSIFGRQKAKGNLARFAEGDILDDPQSNQTTRIPVNDAPSKFWQTVDTYCVPMQHETIRMLEQMVQGREDIEENMKIPDLGVHFSERWALEDMREEQSEGNRANVKNFEKSDGSVHSLMKKASSAITEQEHACPLGFLTQRLISAFVEENIMVPPDQATSMLDSGKYGDNLSSALGEADGVILKPSKSTSAPHVQKLEARIRMELIEQGILEPETTESKKEDEILNEIINCQQELKAVSARNRDVLQQLLQISKGELKKQEVRRKVESANTEVRQSWNIIVG